MSEGATPASAAVAAAAPAEDSDATASDLSQRAAHNKQGSPESTATGEAGRAHRTAAGTWTDQARGSGTGRGRPAEPAGLASLADAAARLLGTPGVATPSPQVPPPGGAQATPPTAPGQPAAAASAALQHVLSGHSTASFLDASGSPRVGGSSSVNLGSRNSLLSSLDSLLGGRQASAPVRQRPGQRGQLQAASAERLLASLLGALRQQQQQQQQRPTEGVPVAPAAPPAAAQRPAPGQPDSLDRQASEPGNALQALLSSVGLKLRAQDSVEAVVRQTATAKAEEAGAGSAELPGVGTMSGAGTSSQHSRGFTKTNSLPIPDPELRRILTGDLRALPPARSQPLGASTVAFQLGKPIHNPFAGFANDLLQRQASSLATHHPQLPWSASAHPSVQQPPAAAAPQAAQSDTASRQSGDRARNASSKRKASAAPAAAGGAAADAEQTAESLPRPNPSQVRRALADVLDWSASSKPGLDPQHSVLQAATALPASASVPVQDLQRHAGDFLRQMREAIPRALGSAQSLPPRSSLTGDPSLKAAPDAAGQAKARATAEDVQRLLGRARAQQAAPASARGEGGAAESNEAAAAAEESEAQQEGEDPADTVDERIKRRRLSNRESARRTRLRRNSEMAKLRGSNEALQQDCEIMRAQLADLAAANQALLASIPRLADQKQQELAAENASLKAELLELRAAVTQHLAAHASSLPYAQSIALSQVIEQARQQANADQEEQPS